MRTSFALTARPQLTSPPIVPVAATDAAGAHARQLDLSRADLAFTGSLTERPARAAIDPGPALQIRRALLCGLTGGFLVVWALELAIAARGGFFGAGVDLGIYTTAARHWLADGTWYLPRQLAGQYGVEFGDVLYPPTLLWLAVPFSVLPGILWWIIPGAIAAIGLARLRPAMWSWPFMAACLAWPRTTAQISFGNPVIWIAASLFWGVGAVALFKPTVIPFALLGLRSRRWWLAAGLMTSLTLPLLPLVLEYPSVLLNARDPGGWLYSIAEWPFLAIPLVAWTGRERRTGPSSSSGPPRARPRISLSPVIGTYPGTSTTTPVVTVSDAL